MSSVTPEQLALIRSLPQMAELHLSIYKPDIILTCQVNNSTITKGSRTIPYNNVTSGSYLNIRSGMTLLVGSTLGGKDLGKIRVKSATASTLVVAENSDIQWRHEAFLTVINFIDIVPIFPRIISDPRNAENTLWYKDYDIPHTNQNDILGSFICMGPHRAGNLDDNGKCSFWFGATGTSHVNGDAISYSWNFPGASNMTGTTSMTPGWVEYDTPQHTTAILIVTSVRGSVDTSYRYVSVYPYNDNSQGWEITNIQGSRQAGGYVLTILLHEPWKYELYDGAPVVVYKTSWYGGTNSELGGNAENCGNIYFSGYILQDSIKWDFEKSTVEFQVGSVTEIMKDITGFAISVENKTTVPTTWYQINKNNLKKSIYHFLRFHSTVLMVTDFQFLALDRYLQFFDSDRGSIYDGVASILKSALLGELVADRQGKLWAETSMDATNSAKSVYLPKFTLLKDDWIGEPTIQELLYNVISYMEMGGIKYNPLITGDRASTAYLSCAPGITPSMYGKVESPTGLALISQEELNQIVGNVFAAKNAKHPTIDIELKGQYPQLDIAPLEAIQVVIHAEDTTKNCEINLPYYVFGLKAAYSGENQYLKTGITLREITEGFPGDTILIPNNPPQPPTPPFPDIPPFPPVPPIPPVPTLANVVAILVPGYGIYHVNIFNDGNYEWVSDNGGFTSEQQAALVNLEAALGTIYTSTNREVFSVKVDGSSTSTIGAEDLFLEHTPDVDERPYHVICIGTDPVTGAVAVLTGRTYPFAITASYISSGGSLGFVRMQELDIEAAAHLIGYSGAWYYTACEGIFFGTYFRRFDGGMADVDYTLPVDGPWELMEVHAQAADVLFLKSHDSLIVRGSNGESLIRNDGDVGNYDCDSTGQYLMYVANDQIYYSDDQAITWTSRHDTLPAPVIRNGQIINLGTPTDWMVTFNNVEAGAVTLNVWRTSDAGLTWQDCLGNLLELGVPGDSYIALIRKA